MVTTFIWIKLFDLGAMFMKTSEFICPVCNDHTFQNESDYDICPVCGWENDGIQRNDFDYWGGANDLSVRESQLFYALSKNKLIMSQLNAAAVSYEHKIKSIYQKYEDIDYTTPDGDLCLSELKKAHDDYVGKLKALSENHTPYINIL
jgi:hypothetical protein